MTWDHSEKTHSNWAETIRKALQEGKVTTEITFDGTRYLITLQPRSEPISEPFLRHKPYQRSTCETCGAYVVWIVRDQKWRHVSPGAYNHDALPEKRKE